MTNERRIAEAAIIEEHTVERWPSRRRELIAQGYTEDQAERLFDGEAERYAEEEYERRYDLEVEA